MAKVYVENGKALFHSDNGLVWVPADQAPNALAEGAQPARYDELVAQREAAEFDAPVTAFALGALRGATFGLSDVAMSPVAREQLVKYKKYNPTASTAGDIAGGVATAFVPGAPVARLAGAGARMAGGISAKMAAKGVPQGLSRFTGRVASEGMQGAVAGGGYGLSEAITTEGDLTADKVMKSIARGAGYGGAFGAGLQAGGSAIAGAARGIHGVAKKRGATRAALLEKQHANAIEDIASIETGARRQALDKLEAEHADLNSIVTANSKEAAERSVDLGRLSADRSVLMEELSSLGGEKTVKAYDALAARIQKAGVGNADEATSALASIQAKIDDLVADKENYRRALSLDAAEKRIFSADEAYAQVSSKHRPAAELEEASRAVLDEMSGLNKKLEGAYTPASLNSIKKQIESKRRAIQRAMDNTAEVRSSRAISSEISAAEVDLLKEQAKLNSLVSQSGDGGERIVGKYAGYGGAVGEVAPALRDRSLTGLSKLSEVVEAVKRQHEEFTAKWLNRGQWNTKAAQPFHAPYEKAVQEHLRLARKSLADAGVDAPTISKVLPSAPRWRDLKKADPRLQALWDFAEESKRRLGNAPAASSAAIEDLSASIQARQGTIAQLREELDIAKGAVSAEGSVKRLNRELSDLIDHKDVVAAAAEETVKLRAARESAKLRSGEIAEELAKSKKYSKASDALGKAELEYGRAVKAHQLNEALSAATARKMDLDDALAAMRGMDEGGEKYLRIGQIKQELDKIGEATNAVNVRMKEAQRAVKDNRKPAGEKQKALRAAQKEMDADLAKLTKSRDTLESQLDQSAAAVALRLADKASSFTQTIHGRAALAAGAYGAGAWMGGGLTFILGPAVISKVRDVLKKRAAAAARGEASSVGLKSLKKTTAAAQKFWPAIKYQSYGYFGASEVRDMLDNLAVQDPNQAAARIMKHVPQEKAQAVAPMVQEHARVYAYLQSVAPKTPDGRIPTLEDPAPTKEAMDKFGRAAAAAINPSTVFSDWAAGGSTGEQWASLMALFPQSVQEFRAELGEQLRKDRREGVKYDPVSAMQNALAMGDFAPLGYQYSPVHGMMAARPSGGDEEDKKLGKPEIPDFSANETLDSQRRFRR